MISRLAFLSLVNAHSDKYQIEGCAHEYLVFFREAFGYSLKIFILSDSFMEHFDISFITQLSLLRIFSLVTVFWHSSKKPENVVRNMKDSFA